MSDLNWMQRYAASEIVEMGREGKLARRDVLRLLGAACGTTAAGAAFLAACGDDKAGSPTSAPRSSTANPSGSTASTTPSVTSTPSTSAALQPPLEGPAGHVLSVAATDPDVVGEDVEFDGPASTMFGYAARPSPAANAAAQIPGVIVIHEIFGLNDHTRDVARRLAKVGYLAIAPDLVSRSGGTDAATDVVGTLVGGPVEDRIADLNATAEYLERQPEFSGTFGVVGFCFGGGMTLSFAAANSQVAAAVPYYGPTPEPASVMSATNAAILAHYGALDDRVNAGIADLEGALEGAVGNAAFEKHVWDGAGHAFNNDTGGSYNEAVAVDAWTLTLRWFDRYL